MKRREVIVFIALMAFLIMALGSCAAAPVHTPGMAVIQQASAASVLSASGGSGGHDTTAFLVGEFTSSDGTVSRFDGRGDLTMVSANGRSTTGTYAMTEYEVQNARVAIQLNGIVSTYTYDLTSASGDFTLTDGSGNVFIFNPVQYN